MASVVARACQVAVAGVLARFQDWVNDGLVKGCVITRHYDSAPMKATFGKLHDRQVAQRLGETLDASRWAAFC